MSSTRNRNRSGNDNYPTPTWAVRRFLEAKDLSAYAGGNWLEPSVGEGSIVQVVNEYVDGVQWNVHDIRDIRPYMLACEVPEKRVQIGDFTENTYADKMFDVAIMNPPFGLTGAFISECLRVAEVVICFQSLNFLGSADRNGWVRRNTPTAYVLPDRVSHSGDGKADSVYPAWYVWERCDSDSHAGELHVLPVTPLAERNRDRFRVKRARDGRRNALDSLFYEVNR